jgi:hypothetical protein
MENEKINLLNNSAIPKSTDNLFYYNMANLKNE